MARLPCRLETPEQRRLPYTKSILWTTTYNQFILEYGHESAVKYADDAVKAFTERFGED